MPLCVECGKEVEQGKEICLPCSIERELDEDVDVETFERFKKEKPKWK